jgi:hypothetical protein
MISRKVPRCERYNCFTASRLERSGHEIKSLLHQDPKSTNKNQWFKKIATKECQERKAEVILHQIILLKLSHKEAQEAQSAFVPTA